MHILNPNPDTRQAGPIRAVRHRRGTSLLWLVLIFMTLIGFVSFAVDFGRVQLAKSEIEAATDAAVRAAGQRFIDGGSAGDMLASAVGAASSNSVNGVPVVVRTDNLLIGVYEPATRTFTQTSDLNVCNAIRVQLNHKFGDDGPALCFLNMLSPQEYSVKSRATIMIGDPPAGFDSRTYTVTTPGGSGGNPGSIVTETTVIEAYLPPVVVPDPTPPVAVTPEPLPYVASPEPTPYVVPTPDPTPPQAPIEVTTVIVTPDTTWTTPETTVTTTVTTPTPRRRTMVQVD